MPPGAVPAEPEGAELKGPSPLEASRQPSAGTPARGREGGALSVPEGEGRGAAGAPSNTASPIALQSRHGGESEGEEPASSAPNLGAGGLSALGTPGTGAGASQGAAGGAARLEAARGLLEHVYACLEDVYASQNAPLPPRWRGESATTAADPLNSTAGASANASTVDSACGTVSAAPVGPEEVLHVAVQVAETAAWVEVESLGSGEAVVAAAKEAAAESVLEAANAVSAPQSILETIGHQNKEYSRTHSSSL